MLLLGWRSFNCAAYLANHHAATWLAQLLTWLAYLANHAATWLSQLITWPIIMLLLGWRSFLPSPAYLANHAATWLSQLITWPIIMLLLGWGSFLPSPAYLANHHTATWLAQLSSLSSLPGQSSCCYLAGAASFPLQLTWPIIMLLLGWRIFLPSPAYLANHHAAIWPAQLPSLSSLPGQSSCCYSAGAAFFPLQLTWPIIMLLLSWRIFLPSPAYLANHHAIWPVQLPSLSSLPGQSSCCYSAGAASFLLQWRAQEDCLAGGKQSFHWLG